MAAAEGQEDYVVKFGDSYHNYVKGNMIRITLSFKNLKDNPVNVKQDIVVVNSNNEKIWNSRINLELNKGQEFKVPFMVPVPQLPGSYTLTIPNNGLINENLSFFKFTVIEPHKSARLSKIQVVTPEWEEGLESFVDTWGIKAPSIAFGQVVLCGKKTLQRLKEKDEEAQQLIDRALKRGMSVILVDFGPLELKEGAEFKIKMPYDLNVKFIKALSPETNFIPERSIKDLNYDLPSEGSYSLNGLFGVSIPAVDMRFEGKDVNISAYVIAGKNPVRTPVVEVKPNGGKGKLILCQMITDGRLDEKVIPPRNKPELPAYDPLAVQFVLNLISASVGDELFK